MRFREVDFENFVNFNLRLLDRAFILRCCAEIANFKSPRMFFLKKFKSPF